MSWTRSIACVAAVAVTSLTAAPATALPSRPVAAVRGTASTAPAHPASRPASAPSRPAYAPVTFGIDSATGSRPDTRYALNFDLSPGAQSEDHVAIVNNSATTLTLDLYAADGTNAADGRIEYLPRQSPGTGARSWITLDTPRGLPTVTVQARSTLVVAVHVQVPQNATPGDHLVGIVVSLPGRARTANGKLLDFDQGVGLPTTFHVSGQLKPSLAVDNLSESYTGTADPAGSGSATVTFTVRNVGNVTLAAHQRVSIAGLFGSTGSAPPSADLPALVPGGSIRRTVHFSDVAPLVHLRAHVQLIATAPVGELVPELPTVTAGNGFWAVPWALLVVVLCLVTLAVAARVWRRSHPATRSRHGARRRAARHGGVAAGKAS